LLRSPVQIFIFQFLSMSLFLNLLFETDSYSKEYLLAKFGFDTAENEPCKVCPLSAYRSPRWVAGPIAIGPIGGIRGLW